MHKVWFFSVNNWFYFLLARNRDFFEFKVNWSLFTTRICSGKKICLLRISEFYLQHGWQKLSGVGNLHLNHAENFRAAILQQKSKIITGEILKSEFSTENHFINIVFLISESLNFSFNQTSEVEVVYFTSTLAFIRDSQNMQPATHQYVHYVETHF